MKRFVTPGVVLTLAVSNVLLCVVSLILGVQMIEGSRFVHTNAPMIWFDSKTAQACYAGYHDHNMFASLAEDSNTITVGYAILDKDTHLPFCSDLK